MQTRNVVNKLNGANTPRKNAVAQQQSASILLMPIKVRATSRGRRCGLKILR